MPGTANEHSLAEKLCGELLTVADLRHLCQMRGFPIVGNGKEELARSAAVRLLDTRGLHEVMDQLDPSWLKLLHLAKALRAPVAMSEMVPIVEPDANDLWVFDYRAFFRKLVSNLLAKGVALVSEDSSAARSARSDSRYARFQLVLPAPFQSELPPYPIAVEAIKSASEERKGALDELLEAALRCFIERVARPSQSKPSTLTERVAAEIELDDGMLQLRAIQHPTGERVTRAVRDIWIKCLVTRSQRERGNAGAIVIHILESLARGTGCTGAQLARELELLGRPVQSETLAAFCEEGVMAGFLLRIDQSGTKPLYRAADALPLPTRTKLDIASDGRGVCTASPSTAFLPLLEVAAVARAAVSDGELRFEPDPIRMGRAWRELSAEHLDQLRSASRAFEQAAQRIEEREGQVIVHRGLGVLRVEDSGLRALLCRRFSAQVRALDCEYLACQLGTLPELVAFAKKEGFVARRVS